MYIFLHATWGLSQLCTDADQTRGQINLQTNQLYKWTGLETGREKKLLFCNKQSRGLNHPRHSISHTEWNECGTKLSFKKPVNNKKELLSPNTMPVACA